MNTFSLLPRWEFTAAAYVFNDYARRRLVIAYARAGNVDAARREYDRLAATVTRPDPEWVTWLDEARDAVRAAEVMGADAERATR